MSCCIILAIPPSLIRALHNMDYTVTFQAEAISKDCVQNTACHKKHVALQSLARAMDLAASDAVQDCVIVIGEGSGVDAFGRLWLRHDDNVRAWARALDAADVDTIHSRRALVRRVQAAEAAVASTLGIAGIFAGDRLGLSSVYEDYLRVSVFSCQSVSSWRPLCARC